MLRVEKQIGIAPEVATVQWLVAIVENIAVLASGVLVNAFLQCDNCCLRVRYSDYAQDSKQEAGHILMQRTPRGSPAHDSSAVWWFHEISGGGR